MRIRLGTRGPCRDAAEHGRARARALIDHRRNGLGSGFRVDSLQTARAFLFEGAGAMAPKVKGKPKPSAGGGGAAAAAAAPGKVAAKGGAEKIAGAGPGAGAPVGPSLDDLFKSLDRHVKNNDYKQVLKLTDDSILLPSCVPISCFIALRRKCSRFSLLGRDPLSDLCTQLGFASP